MRTDHLLAAGALAVAVLTTPSAAIADPAVVTPSGLCATHIRWVAPRGAEGGHYVGTCDRRPSWVPARGTEGGHYDSQLSTCLRWVAPRGAEGGHYVGTCPQQPRWVPARGAEGGHYEWVAGKPASVNPRPISTTAEGSAAQSSRFDFGSAAIGAATVVCALAIALAMITGVRRRRVAGPGVLPTR